MNSHIRPITILLRPLRDRRAWIVAGGVVIIALALLIVFGSQRMHEGSRLVSGVLLSFALGFIADGLVLLLLNSDVVQPGAVLAGLDALERQKIRRTFAFGDPNQLPESDRPYAVKFANAYRLWLPTRTAPILALMVGLLLESLSQLRTWDGGILSLFLVLELVIGGIVLLALLPLQLRRLRRVNDYLETHLRS